MYGKRYVWIIIGWYEDKWWEKSLDQDDISCSTDEMRKAVEGYLATDHLNLNEDEITSNKRTVSGWVGNTSKKLICYLSLRKTKNKKAIKTKKTPAYHDLQQKSCT